MNRAWRRAMRWILQGAVMFAGCLAGSWSGSGAAEVQTREVRYRDGEVELVGYLAWDDGFAQPRPGVLVVHEWWGLNDYARRRARQLAELGYVAFAVDMYGEGKVTQHPQEAGQWAAEVRQNVDRWVQRARAGLQVLRRQKGVDPQRIAAIGYCFGGATVLQLAYAGEPLAGVVSFHGALPVPTDQQKKQIRAPILICHGAADPFIPAQQIQAVQAALEEAGADWQMIFYAGARHSFTNPGADQAGLQGVGYHPAADRRSWQHMQLFFQEIFGHN